jgi:hypothetical protein
MSVNVGSNKFKGCEFPLVVLNRYFRVEAEDPPLITVIRDDGGDPIFEVIRNVPQAANVRATKNPTGVITINDADGGFLYKLRPGSESTIVFGNVGGKELPVWIRDKEIRVGGTTIEANMMGGMAIGVMVSVTDDRVSIGMGVGKPTPAMRRWKAASAD